MYDQDTIVGDRYRIEKLLKKGPSGCVYTAVDSVDRRRVVIKTFTAAHTAVDIVRFHTEQEIISEIKHPGVVRICGHGGFEIFGEAGQYVAMEHVEGRTLEEAVADGEFFTLDEIVRGAAALCSALEAVHGRGLIHGDLKPENIIVSGGDSGPPAVTLVDFGAARLKSYDQDGLDGYIDGTFACMAPEQCGLIHAPVDESSDLYALGVLLYRLLTNRYPCEGDSLSALLHDKIAKTPEPPSRHNPDVPPALDRIVLKLLEKEPANRYREVSGLLFDLERVRQGERDFSPGEQDFGRVSFKAPLIGREKNLYAIEKTFGNITGGHAAVCLVIGEAGVGKTRLLQEFRKTLLERGVLALEGRALKPESRETWSLFRGTMKEYLKTYQCYGEEKKNRVAAFLRRECADFGAVVTGLVPGMELVLGKCAPLAALKPERESQRFFLSLQRFLRNLVAAEGGMAVFLDDLHWADEGSIRLIEETMKGLAASPVFLLASLRGEERSSRPVMDMAARLREGGALTVRSLFLGPLGVKGVARYLAAVLHLAEGDTDELASRVFRQTGGNPFYTEELVRHFFRQGVLVRDEGRWRVNPEKFDDAGLPDNVLDAIGARIAVLPEDDLDVLSRAAVIGRSFSVDILIEVHSGNEARLDRIKKVMSAMANAARECLVMEDVAERGMVVFTHDRIRDAFRRRLGAAARRKLHDRIVTALERRGEHAGASVFDLAHHALESGDREKIIAYAGVAGKRAMEGYAYDDAIRYFGDTLKALEEGASGARGDDQKNARREVMELFGECLVYAGRLDDGIKVFDGLLALTEDINKKGVYYQYMALACFRKGDFKGCESYASRGLKLYGERVPTTRAGVIIGIVKELLVHFLRPKFVTNRLFNQNKHAERIKVIINNYKWLLYAYYWWEGKRALRTIFRMGNLAERCSNCSEELAETYYHYGMLYATTGFFKKAERYCEQSKVLHLKSNNQTGLAQTLNALGLIAILKGEFEKCLKICNSGLEIIERVGNYIEICKYTQFIFLSHYLLSNYKTSKEVYNRYLYINTTLFEEMMYSGCIYPVGEYIEKGDLDAALLALNKFIKDQEENNLWYLNALSLMCLGKIYSEKKDYLKSREIFERCIHIAGKEFLPMHYLCSVFPFYADTLINCYRYNSGGLGYFQRQGELHLIKRNVGKALRKSKRFKHHYDVALRTAAHYHHLRNNNKKARYYFERAIEKSAAMGKRYQEARTRYEYGLWLMEQKEHDRAWVQLDRAYMIFKDIDIVPYQKKILDLMRFEGERRDPLRRYLDRERKDRVAACIDEINRCGGYRELLDTALARAMEICGARAGGVFIADSGTGVLRLDAHRTVDGGEFEYSGHVLEECFAGRKAVLTTSAEESEEFSVYRSVSAAGLKSILCLPLRRGELVVGACYLDNKLAAGVFSPDDVRLLSLFLSSAAVLIENALLTEKMKTVTPREETVDAALGEEHAARAAAYIERNFDRELSRDEIAREIGVSPDYLGKVFKAHTGRSMHDFINEVRVKWALDQLVSTDRKIIDVAFDAGFESLRTFNRVFTRIMGGPPKKYRGK